MKFRPALLAVAVLLAAAQGCANQNPPGLSADPAVAAVQRVTLARQSYGAAVASMSELAREGRLNVQTALALEAARRTASTALDDADRAAVSGDAFTLDNSLRAFASALADWRAAQERIKPGVTRNGNAH